MFPAKTEQKKTYRNVHDEYMNQFSRNFYVKMVTMCVFCQWNHHKNLWTHVHDEYV
jgi:hypothetical protein